MRYTRPWTQTAPPSSPCDQSEGHGLSRQVGSKFLYWFKAARHSGPRRPPAWAASGAGHAAWGPVPARAAPRAAAQSSTRDRQDRYAASRGPLQDP